MTIHELQGHWALLLGCALGAILAAAVLWHWLTSTSYAQLRRGRKVLRSKRKELHKSNQAVAAAERKVTKLHSRADREKPRDISEADESLADARALAKIAHDQVLIAENHLRRIIVEEYPPSKQARLRAKYQVCEVPDKRPFTF
ncbi:MAG TPA: hypothetical protein VMO24_02040 [Woeseiaceae bacterium]|nr:hypothetical protein [Woeseiaceae bacterium]